MKTMGCACQTRRGFLGRLVALAGGLVGWEWGRAWAGSFTGGAKEKWIDLGPLRSFPDGARTLATRGTLLASGRKANFTLMIWRRGERADAMSMTCTHMGVKVNRLDDGTYSCHEHGSTFDPYGCPTRGPAKRCLRWYETRLDEGGNLQVNILQDVDPPKPVET
jgi:Rieske Fe-S protein